jgi:hypothetical protein
VASCPVGEWRAIVAKAVEQAKAGDAKAREWLGKHLIGDEPLALAELLREVEDLKAAVREQSHAHGNNRRPAPGSGTAEDGPAGGGGPVAGPAAGGPGGGDGPGGPAAGRLAG